MIEIRDQHRQRYTTAAASLPLPGKTILEHPAVRQAGQTIEVGPLFQDRHEMPGAKRRTNPRHQLGPNERLGDNVAGPQVKGTNSLFRGGDVGIEQNRVSTVCHYPA